MRQDKYLQSTKLLDFEHSAIKKLIADRRWQSMAEYDRILAIYNYVKDEIKFGYNLSDTLVASEILNDGYGQCNTKTILFMALLRSVRISCRFHGFTIHKELQKGLVNNLAYFLAPREIIHSWAEVLYDAKWFELEGLILDKAYLNGLKSKFKDHQGSFCGYGVDVNEFENIPNEWQGCNTYIQKEGIVRDFGIFSSPDEFYDKHGANFSGLKKLIFTKIVRKIMNNNVINIRG
ncbi:MAG: hypothetical protein UT64_C0014G0003 [Candidatus Falkowbacteria bacterium GW2011_GWF2_39_8]|uniref:Transglutaminase-like domain-containing protein n=1 Tax=Candidatus Falkowbacteria bacterium GW2011_GWF2_39_8 TaxID=1618642 RepID=A0A0G0SEK2_9BACT|nr:MAG: hypothetical protein UT64_C0014G0003 [Candidatus Falkowbacteria bacterium GW2011_GWF2_39_8]